MARILLGVSGGIAAYKACTLVRLLVRAGHDVHPVLTEGGDADLDLLGDLRLRPAGLLLDELPLVVVGHEEARAADE